MSFSFKQGWLQVQQKDARTVKQKIMERLGITTRVSWEKRLKGEIEPKVSEAKAIEDVFAEYKIKNVWGK